MKLHRQKAVTLVEVVVAMALLAIAVLPLFNLISKKTEETDINAAQAFALTKASEVLNTILDNVPFEVVRMGNPGYLSTANLPSDEYAKFDATWLSGIAQMLFPGTSPDGNLRYPCKAVISDPRGIDYLVTLAVEDLAAPPSVDKQPERKKIGSSYPDSQPQDFSQKNEITFAFLENPGKLSDPAWIQNYNIFTADSQPPRWESELAPNGLGVAQPNENIYRDEGYAPGDDSPRFIDPTAVRYTQRMAAEKVNYTDDDAFKYCTMKRLIVEVQWNMEKRYYKSPEVEGPQTQRIHLITLKGDIDR